MPYRRPCGTGALDDVLKMPGGTSLPKSLVPGETSGRADDNIETIKKRFKTFIEQSIPVVDAYESRGLVSRAPQRGGVAC